MQYSPLFGKVGDFGLIPPHVSVDVRHVPGDVQGPHAPEKHDIDPSVWCLECWMQKSWISTSSAVKIGPGEAWLSTTDGVSYWSWGKPLLHHGHNNGCHRLFYHASWSPWSQLCLFILLTVCIWSPTVVFVLFLFTSWFIWNNTHSFIHMKILPSLVCLPYAFQLHDKAIIHSEHASDTSVPAWSRKSSSSLLCLLNKIF